MEEKNYQDVSPAQKTKAGRPWRRILLLLIVIALILLAVLLATRQRPQVRIVCGPPNTSAGRDTAKIAAVTHFSLEGQIIVTGPASEIENVLAQATKDLLAQPQGKDPQLSPLRTCAIQVHDTRALDVQSLPFPPETLSSLAMNLYQIDTGQPVERVIAAIKKAGKEHHVHADPNYLTGILGHSSCGSPHTVVGSPHTVVGSPFEIIASPHTVVGSPAGDSMAAAAELFWHQWSFEHVGLGPSLAQTLDGVSLHPTGTGVRVGVFDTSPFTPNATTTLTWSKTITWITPSLHLRISHPEMTVLTPTGPITAQAKIKDHGLFVASLIHAAAPESEIYLIRVLNEYGCGDLFTLNEALFHFISGVEKTSDLDGAVINLSLGIQKPRISDSIFPLQSLQVAGETMADPQPILITDTIESLQAVVSLAYSKNIVVVAAAGNDSYLEDKPLAPHLPAAYPFVIGVSASNNHRQRACFSNWGDVTAPGGEGGPGEVLVLTPEGNWVKRQISCAPMAAECSDNCPNALIGLASASPTKYMYWSGTSFSAPLVSGLVALVQDAGATANKGLSPKQAFEAIRCGAPTGDGVLDAPATLFRCTPKDQ